MAMMEFMRGKTKIFILATAALFLLMIVFEWGMDYLGIKGSRADVVGKINGTKISYKDFSDQVQRFNEEQKAQTGADPDEAQLKQARDQVWQNLVNQQLIEAEVKRLGLRVTDQELRDWVFGDNPPEDLRRNFIDSTGQFRSDIYQQFLADPNQFLRDPRGGDPEYGTHWLVQYEQSLRDRRVRDLLQSILLATVHVGEGEVLQHFTDQNMKYDAGYVAFDPNTLVPDSMVQVTDADLHTYYEENIDQYKFEPLRKLKYVRFAEKPSAADSADREKEIRDALGKAKQGTDFIQLVYTYSEKPDSGAFFRHGELNAPIETAVFQANVGSVVGPLLDADGYHIFKVLGSRQGKNEYVHAAHILLPLQGDTNAVKKLAQTVVKEAREGKDFAALATQYSKDPGSAGIGGDLGWFTKGRMVPAFENACFKAKPGQVVGPIRTQFGLHIIKVEGRDNRELKLANILVKIVPSSQTKSDIEDRAKDFAFNAKQTEFAKEAQSMGFTVQETQVQGKGGVIPGIGVNESIAKWAFNSGVGSVSEAQAISNGFAVFSVSEVRDAGVRPFDEVKESLRPTVLREKKLDKAMESASAARTKFGPADSLGVVCREDTRLQVRHTGSFALSSSVPGIGRDQAFMGTVSGLNTGQISPAVRGQRAAYLIQLIAKTAFDSTAFAAQKESIRSQMLQEKQRVFVTDWLAKLKENADIEDNRDTFFR